VSLITRYRQVPVKTVHRDRRCVPVTKTDSGQLPENPVAGESPAAPLSDAIL